MTDLEKLNALSAAVYAETVKVAKENPTLAKGTALMRKHGVSSIADGFCAEAIARLNLA